MKALEDEGGVRDYNGADYTVMKKTKDGSLRNTTPRVEGGTYSTENITC